MKKLLPLLFILGSAFTFTSCGSTSFEGKLVIGLECDYAPFNWSETSPNEHTLKVFNKNLYCDGYDVQIAKILGRELNMEVIIMQTPWTALVSDLQMGTINAIIAGMTDTEERRESISFTNEYYRSELVLIVSKNIAEQYENQTLNEEQFQTLVYGKNIVSQDSTVTNDVIEIFEENYGAIHSQPLDSFSLAATDVSIGSAFAMTAELPVAQSIVSSFTNLGIIHIDQNILGETQSELGVSIGINKNNPELKDKINNVLETIETEERVRLMSEAVIRSSQS